MRVTTELIQREDPCKGTYQFTFLILDFASLIPLCSAPLGVLFQRASVILANCVLWAGVWSYVVSCLTQQDSNELTTSTLKVVVALVLVMVNPALPFINRVQFHYTWSLTALDGSPRTRV